jgi:hypothetical protein
MDEESNGIHKEMALRGRIVSYARAARYPADVRKQWIARTHAQ